MMFFTRGVHKNYAITTIVGKKRLTQAKSLNLDRWYTVTRLQNQPHTDEKYLSKISRLRKPSAIRRLQPLVSLPNMISLGGGLPNPELFPIGHLTFGLKDPRSKKMDEIILTDEELSMALQYSPTSGLPSLKNHLIGIQKREHGRFQEGDDMDIVITVGSQDGFCKAIEMLIDPENRDLIFLETPTYSGALSFLNPFGAKLVPIMTDEFGLVPSKLEESLEIHLSGENAKNMRRILYTIPTAQNPSGATLSQERRIRVYKLAQIYDLIILEDDPYYFLHPNRGSFDSFLSMDTDRRVLRFDSFSKVVSSGLRVGFVTGPRYLIEKLNLHIQATNLHNSGLSQILLQKVLDHWGEEGFNRHCRLVADFYCNRRNMMLAAASKHLEGLVDFKAPEAGMFLWMKLNKIEDSKQLIEEKAPKANVLLVPGQAFLPEPAPSPFVRVSFSTASDSDMDTAMERLATLLQSEVGN